MFESTTFAGPNFQMGNSGGRVLQDYLSRQDDERMREQNERAQFEAAQLHLKKNMEQENLARVMRTNGAVTPDRGILAGVNGIIGGTEGSNNMGGGVGGGGGNLRQSTRIADPSLNAYRMGQLELGRDKLDLARDTAEGKQDVATRGVAVRESLAALKDLPESERIKRLQDGRMSLADYQASAEMKKQELIGTQRTDQIKQQGNNSMAVAKENNAAAISRTKEGGYQSRLTKQTPDAAKPPSEGDMKIQLQRRAVAAINRNPSLGSVITFNEQGFPIINEGADQQLQIEAAQALHQAGPDVNLPASGVTPPSNKPPMTEPPMMSSRGSVSRPTVPYTPPVNTAVPPKPATPPKSGTVKVIAPDGRSGSWDLSQGPIPKGYRQVQ